MNDERSELTRSVPSVASRRVAAPYGVDDLAACAIRNTRHQRILGLIEVDLGAQQVISYALIYNRIDCCQDRLGHFELWIGNESQAPLARCAVYDAPATAGPFSVSCRADGQFVTILLPGSARLLNLVEVEVYGVPTN